MEYTTSKEHVVRQHGYRVVGHAMFRGKRVERELGWFPTWEHARDASEAFLKRRTSERTVIEHAYVRDDA